MVETELKHQYYRNQDESLINKIPTVMQLLETMPGVSILSHHLSALGTTLCIYMFVDIPGAVSFSCACSYYSFM